MMKSKKGFTLAELLIVVAIIAVLVAIAIPVFASELEKSREATDAANIRSHYAEIMTEANVTGGDVNTDGSLKVMLRQSEDNWQNDAIPVGLSNLGTFQGNPARSGSAWVVYQQEGDSAIIHFDGGT